MVGVLGLEPRTSALSGLRSSQLSYTPEGAGVYPRSHVRQARARPGRPEPPVENDTSRATVTSRGSWKETPGVDLLSRRKAVSSAPRA